MSRRRRATAAVLAVCVVAVGCSGHDQATPTIVSDPSTVVAPTDPVPSTSATARTDATEPPVESTTTLPPTGEWAVATDVCADPAAATAPIGAIVHVASVMPLSNSNAAPAFAPVKDGFQAYIDHARQQGLFRGYDDIELAIEDDQYDPAVTPTAVATQIEAGADLFSGIIGTKNNESVRQVLNKFCIPQLNALTGSPMWGDAVAFPWTTGLLVPYSVETQVYAAQLSQLFPAGATVGVFSVDNEFGRAYVQALADHADAFHLDLVASQTVAEADTESPALQVAAIAAAAPDGIVAVPLGAGCISFLTELAAARFSHPGWNPAVFITNTCASNLIMAAAGGAADQVYSSDNLLDLADPTVQALPQVQEYLESMNAQGLAASIADTTVGWTTGEITVAILNQAASSPAGLTRASIIDAARDLQFVPSLARPGVVLTSHGVDDPYLAQSLQVLQYHADQATFVAVGSVVTQFES